MGKENSKNFVLGGPDDFRLLENGRVIPSEYYADQPYIVKTDDGAWLCCITTGKGAEGASGQHVVTMKSFDEGKTWSEPVSVEPDGSPENSYAVMAKAPDGRVFIFYNFNADNIRKVKADNPPVYRRILHESRFSRTLCFQMLNRQRRELGREKLRYSHAQL